MIVVLPEELKPTRLEARFNSALDFNSIHDVSLAFKTLGSGSFRPRATGTTELFAIACCPRAARSSKAFPGRFLFDHDPWILSSKQANGNACLTDELAIQVRPSRNHICPSIHQNEARNHIR
ncbi:hypothetical protein HGRIS_002307 [Hohenbuehelia grisea]|uniref:Uncharacterized protein n=1 Tax=Hohenbuehelia grisea TaxID=104357 RepID=A0ABR3JK36_9AGAR